MFTRLKKARKYESRHSTNRAKATMRRASAWARAADKMTYPTGFSSVALIAAAGYGIYHRSIEFLTHIAWGAIPLVFMMAIVGIGITKARAGYIRVQTPLNATVGRHRAAM